MILVLAPIFFGTLFTSSVRTLELESRYTLYLFVLKKPLDFTLTTLSINCSG